VIYPTKVEINGNIYPINTDYRVALKCFEIINDNDIGDMERTYAVIYKLFGFIPSDEEIGMFIEKVSLYLGCGETQDIQQSKNRDMDINHDMKYIIASFRSDYNIDIVNENMHWYEFVDLISGFTSKSIMSRIRDIRNYDLSEVRDPKLRRKIIEAQESVALPKEYTQEQIEVLEEFESLFEVGGE